MSRCCVELHLGNFQGHFRFFCWLLQNYAGTIQRQAHFKIANREAKEYRREHKKKFVEANERDACWTLVV